MAEKKKFIQEMHMKKGALHKELHVPKGEKIPKKKLEKAAEHKGIEGKRARLAETLEGMHHKKHKHTHHEKMMKHHEKMMHESMKSEHHKDKMPKAKAKVEKVMHEFKEHALHSGSKKGPEVTNPKQALAIAISESRKVGYKHKK